MKVTMVYTNGHEDSMGVSFVVNKDDHFQSEAQPPLAIPVEVRLAIIDYLKMEKVG